MSDINTPVKVETQVNAGPVATVENPGTTVIPEFDVFNELQEVIKKNTKLSADLENYKTVALARKRGETIADPTVLTEEEIEKRAEEKAQILINQRELEASAKRSLELAEKAAKENQELRTALKNRNGIATVPSGSTSMPDMKAAPHGWTTEQVAYMKNVKKMSDDTIQKAWAKFKSLS